MSAFGTRLRELREKAGLTQPALAALAGMNMFGIAKLEQGLREPTWATVRSLAKALGVTCQEFDLPEETVQADPVEPRPRGRPRKPEAEVAEPEKGTAKKVRKGKRKE